ncbi:hypothetical protein [Flavobacterium chungnamense]|uniref:Translational machinery protein n=1 Tax=Flavobacterium chungnamense TaxID=706182 RepID=A0ABP7UEP4_9FLAO
MKTPKRLSIWMDHSVAHLMEISNQPFEIKTIDSNFTNEVKLESIKHGENSMHNKEQQLMLTFYKKLVKIIKNYDEILLFGPTNAKNELHNLIEKDHQIASTTKIKIKETDKMTQKEQEAFIKNHFENLNANYNVLFDK